ncbi:MAG: JAB domain-containing protein [Candidatus Accumulibacter similis]|nr:MAG: JAB domain-containing protein [Candidatus Accumulibacter similis]
MATRNRTTARPPARPEKPALACIHLLDDRQRRVIQRAFAILEQSATYRSEALLDPASVRAYLALKFAGLEREEAVAIWLDSQNRVIAFDVLSTGTIWQAALYPREVVKTGLRHNAAAIILAHNHPSGELMPSAADERLTADLQAALSLVEIRLLDHFIVGGGGAMTSFAEIGLL